MSTCQHCQAPSSVYQKKIVKVLQLFLHLISMSDFSVEPRKNVRWQLDRPYKFNAMNAFLYQCDKHIFSWQDQVLNFWKMKFIMGTLMAGVAGKSLSKSVKVWSWKLQILKTWCPFIFGQKNFIHFIKGIEQMHDQLSEVMQNSKKISERQIADTLAGFETAGAVPKVS